MMALPPYAGHQSLTSGMELKKNILVSGNADSTVKVGSCSCLAIAPTDIQRFATSAKGYKY